MRKRRSSASGTKGHVQPRKTRQPGQRARRGAHPGAPAAEVAAGGLHPGEPAAEVAAGLPVARRRRALQAMLAVELAAVLGVKMEMITVGGRACACGLDGRSAEEKIEMVRKVRGVSRLRERRRKPASRKKEDEMEAKPTLDSAAAVALSDAGIAAAARREAQGAAVGLPSRRTVRRARGLQSPQEQRKMLAKRRRKDGAGVSSDAALALVARREAPGAAVAAIAVVGAAGAAGAEAAGHGREARVATTRISDRWWSG
mmetsp:Transcript_70849/g.135091  ORF Transcript_70849/g.135091 Transcript_70849/m.135091 type:complete len:258 (-) Transcript_70849:3333-4106(-)